jgi:hypothetical protein
VSYLRPRQQRLSGVIQTRLVGGAGSKLDDHRKRIGRRPGIAPRVFVCLINLQNASSVLPLADNRDMLRLKNTRHSIAGVDLMT